MSKRENISMSVVRRLPRYYRFLSELKMQGIMRISSKELADRMKLTASQVRQDFNCFGGFGQQGYGYSVEQLYDEIENILGLQGRHKTVLIGAGNLGRAVATHMSFETRGFELIGIFDRDKTLIGQEIREVLVGDIKTWSSSVSCSARRSQSSAYRKARLSRLRKSCTRPESRTTGISAITTYQSLTTT